MATTLNTIKDNPGARHRKMIVGRGIGSGKGKTCGRGVKGQKARSGVAIKGFEGGQMPIYRRLPKRGFHNDRRVEFQALNVSRVQFFIDNKKLNPENITKQAMYDAGVLKTLNNPVKLLAKGEIKSKITIEVDAASKSAVASVEKAGGKINFAQIKVSEKPAKEASAKKSVAPKK